MHIMPADIIEAAEPIDFADLRNLLGLDPRILRALLREREENTEGLIAECPDLLPDESAD